MSLEEEMLAVATKEMSDAIDWQVMSGMLVEMGWTLIKIPRYVDNAHAIDIREWVRESCKGKSNSNGATWIFEDPGDATMFTLRWT